MVLRMIVGFGLTVVAVAVAGRRLWWLGAAGDVGPAGTGAG